MITEQWIVMDGKEEIRANLKYIAVTLEAFLETLHSLRQLFSVLRHILVLSEFWRWFSLFKTLCIKWDLIKIFHVALFKIDTKCDCTVQSENLPGGKLWKTSMKIFGLLIDMWALLFWLTVLHQWQISYRTEWERTYCILTSCCSWYYTLFSVGYNPPCNNIRI